MLSFTYVARKEQRKALSYATNENGDISLNKRQEYLDKIYDSTIYNFLGAKYTYKDVKETELALGLDLQGGMHVTLEVSPVEILTALAGSNSSKPEFKRALQVAKEKQRNSQESFTDLFYESYQETTNGQSLSSIFANSINQSKGINSQSTDDEVAKMIDSEVDEAIGRAEEIIRNRVDKFGAVQPNIQRLKNSQRIQVELPGVENPQRVRSLLQGAAKLEFLEVYQVNDIFPALNAINAYLLTVEQPEKNKTGEKAVDKTSAEKLLTGDTTATANSGTDTTASSVVAKADSAAADTTAPKASSLFTLLKSPYTLRYAVKDTAKINKVLAMPRVQDMLPANLEFLWEQKPEAGQDGSKTLELVPVKKGRAANTLTGDVIVNARADVSQDGKNFEVSMQMNTIGAKKWKKMTAEASKDPKNPKRIAIVLDENVVSAPVVNGEIPNGNSSITGNFTFEEASDLASKLKAGKLPAPVRIVEEVIVGPSLGKESIQQGLFSIVAGLLLVVAFMVFYYAKGGFVANVALLFNVLFILGVMASLGSVLTLPGIAGIVLTVGMAVDANVLIFERVREEIANGKSLLTAIDLGYQKAFSSIFDSNVTTLLTGAILYGLGSGPVKGFAVTLIIGIICSFFTSVYISKVIVMFMVKKGNEKSVTFSTLFSRNLFKNLNFDIIGKRKLAYFFSGGLITLGIISIIAQGGLNFGVDFKGGRSFVVQFSQPVSASKVKADLSDDLKNASTEVKTYGSDDRLKITTSFLMEDETSVGDQQVEKALMDGLTELNVGNFEIQSSSKVGATVADDIQNASWKALILSLAGIFIYILFRFKKWQFSLGSVIALLHDALMVISIFSILRWFGIAFEIDQVFVAAILTIVGYSINDTVVVFDRVREFIADNPRLDLATVLNKSINHTFSRTIITALTVFLVVFVLAIFGGETLRGFSVAMIIGVVFGSYSSIFIAVPIVLDFNSNDPKPEPAPSSSTKKPLATA